MYKTINLKFIKFQLAIIFILIYTTNLFDNKIFIDKRGLIMVVRDLFKLYMGTPFIRN